jgi:hypothetical protein
MSPDRKPNGLTRAARLGYEVISGTIGSTNLMSRHFLSLNSVVNRMAIYSQVGGNFFNGQPALLHKVTPGLIPNRPITNCMYACI